MEDRDLFNANSARDLAGPKFSGQLSVTLESAGSPARARLERQISAKFAAQYEAKLNQFHPFLIALQSTERPLAIAGLRPAREGRLILENYFDRPAEQAVSSVFRRPVDRTQIVEIGNLVSSEPGISYLLFAVLAPLLRDAGFRWVICTATPQVEGMLKRMRLGPGRICAASPDQLKDEATTWGTYYDSQPNVIAGNLEFAASRIGCMPKLSAYLDQLDGWPAAIDKISLRRMR